LSTSKYLVRFDKPSECEDFPQDSDNGKFTIFPFGNEFDSVDVFCNFEPRGYAPYEAAQTYLNVNPGTVKCPLIL